MSLFLENVNFLVDAYTDTTHKQPEFCLLDVDKNKYKYKIEIDNAVFYVHKVKVSPLVLLAHAKSSDEATFKYTVKRTECRTFSIGKGLREVYIPNAFLGP